MIANVKLIICLLILSLVLTLSAQYPESKQATLIEMSSSSEALIEATGIYKSGEKKDKKAKKDVDENGVSLAIEDARKSAVYFLLLGGTDPLISNAEEEAKFEKQAGEFFNSDNISRYISFEETKIVSKVKINGGKGMKIKKRFKVNKDMIKKDLIEMKVIKSMEDLAEAIGTPFIMVIPDTKTPLETLVSDPEAKHAASVVESFLTARKYDVVVPEQQSALESLNEAQMNLGDREEDYAYNLALSIGSDVYITYGGTLEDAGYGTKKYAMNVRAFETTTARLLGTETGYSQGRQGETMVSIEEAMNDAIENVLSRISNYWKDDMKNGIQYKVITNISTDFDEDEVEEIQFAFMEAIESISNKSKNNITTQQTLDYLIWVDAQEYDKSMKVYMELKKAYKNAGAPGELKKVNINRKMILLKLDYE